MEETFSSDYEKPECKGKFKEPLWPLVLGSVVPALAIGLFLFALWYVNFGGVFDRLPHSQLMIRVATQLLLWIACAKMIYAAIAFLIDYLVLWYFLREKFRLTLLLTYSLRAWKLTGFLITFGATLFLIYSAQAWLASLALFWVGLFTAFLVGLSLAAAILRSAHKVKITVASFLVLGLTEVISSAASLACAVFLFAAFALKF